MGHFEAFVGVNFWTALFVLLNTLTIYFVAKKFLFGPVMKMIQDRQKEIDDMYAQADTAKEQAQALEGLILLAAYSTADLTETGLEVLSLYGTEDGVLNRQKYESSRVNLPEGFREVIIEGGNHAQFGSYGPQEGDGTAAITQTAQIRQTADAIAAWMQEMGS